MKHGSKRFLSILLSLVLLLGLMPGMSLTAYAETTTGSITYKLDKGGLNQADDVVIDPQELSVGFEGRQWSAGSALTVEGTARYHGATGEDSILQTKITNNTGAKFSDNPEAGNTLTLTFSLNDGFTFSPSRVSFQAAVYATDTGNITATVQAGENTVMIVDNGSVNRDSRHITIQTYSGEVSGVTANSDQPLNLNFSFLKLGNNKCMGLSNLVIEGTLVKQSLAVTSVTLPATATVNKDEKVSLTATIEPSTATDKKVKWSVGGTNSGAVKLYSDADCKTEVGTGATETLTVYAKGMSAGSATVTATSNADSTKSASCNVTVSSLDPVSYLAWDGEKLVEKKGDAACKDYTVVTDQTEWGTAGKETWYVVNAPSADNLTISNRITVNGTVNLILCDGAKLTASKGICVQNGKTLNIYGQSAGTGELLITGNDLNKAGIGGNSNQAGGTVNIHGGTVTVTGSEHGAGIGGGSGKTGAGGTVTIYGGTVTATGGKGAAGIGGGDKAAGGTVTIYGGTVNATSGHQNAKGIGGGLNSSDDGTLTLGAGVGIIVSTDNSNWSAYDGSTRTQYMKTGTAHTHDFTYSANGATITATCGAAGCGLTSNPTLTIVKPTLTTYGETGKSEAATLDGVADFNTATGLSVADTAIKYYKATKGEGDAYTKGDEITGGAPTGAGDYMAEITLTGVKTGAETTGDVAASVGYTIAKADPAAPTGLTATYGQTLVNVTLPEGWTWSDSTQSVGDVVSPAATFKADFAGDDNYNEASDVDVTVTVSAADPATPTDLTATYGQTLADVTLPTNWAWAAETATSVGNVGTNTFKANYTSPNANYNSKTDVDVEVTVDKANAVAATVAANNRTYDGTEQALVTVTGTPTGGEMQYALGTATEATEQYTTSIPAKTDADTYYVWYKVVGDGNHNDYAPDAPVAVTIGKANASATAPTAKSLTYTGGALALLEAGSAQGGELRYSLDGESYSPDIPTATAANKYTVFYKVFGDANHNDSEVGTIEVTINSADAGSTAPSAGSLTYTGDALALVTGGSVSGGELQYALGEDAANAPADGAFGTDVPTGTDAGTYFVWYRVKGDANHNDVAPACVTVEIAQADIAPTVSLTGWTYGETANAPSVDGNLGNGAVTYEYSDNENDGFGPTVPTDADTYYVRAVVAPTANYQGATSAPLSFAIARASIAPTVSLDGWTYGQTANAPGVDGNPGGGQVTYTYSDAPDGTFTADVPTNAGTWYVRAEVAQTANYGGATSAATAFEIAKASFDAASLPESQKASGISAMYDGEPHSLLTAPAGLPEGYTKVQYSIDGGSTWTDEVPVVTDPGSYTVKVKYVGDANHADVEGDAIVVDITARPSGRLFATMVSDSSTSLKLTWTGAEGVGGYDIYFKVCDGKDNYPLYATVRGSGASSYIISNLAKNRSYKAYVRAWIEQNGNKEYVLGSSPDVHCYTGNGTKVISNPGSLTLKKTAMTLKLGKSMSIKASVKGIKKGKLKNHVAKVRYISSDPSVASVSTKGKVKAVGGGSCVIYVLTTNGICKTVNVTVDANPTKLRLVKPSKTMKAGTTQDLGAKLKLTPAKANRSLTWTSSNSAVASVDANGKVTAIKKGKATITVTATGGKKTTVTINVK